MPIIGFDTGPGNGLLNAWIEQQQGETFDRDGQWASTGVVNSKLLTQCLREEYFQLPAPKSTGRELFNLNWLQRQMDHLDSTIPDNDIQATLSQLTAQSIAQHIEQYMPECEEILVCGGGWHNRDLIVRLGNLSKAHIISTADDGIDPDFMEAMCFAWLARQSINKNTGNLCSVTGAAQPVILGAIFSPPPNAE
jgi:anhydro-N-acetylmuramic acid kinase